MHPFLGKRAEIKPGASVIIESDSLDGARGVVFEEDGETGYFYARDFQIGNSLFVDALHIYAVAVVKDAHIPPTLRIIWSRDWQKAALLINDIPHAMFDFVEKCGYSNENS